MSRVDENRVDESRAEVSRGGEKGLGGSWSLLPYN